MKITPAKFASIVAIALAVTGCTPSKPIYLNDTGQLNHFVDQATAIEYPDFEPKSLEEVTLASPPITVTDPDFESFRDLTLEEAVGYALQNGKVLIGYGTPSLQGTRVSPGVDNIVNSVAAAGTIYDVAVRETEPGIIGTPGQIAQPGGILTNTGLDVNQGVEGALADFDAQFSSSVSFLNSDEPRNTVSTNPNIPLVFQQDQVQWQSEIAKRTANGTQLFFRNINSYTDNSNPLASDVPPGFQVLDSFYRTTFEAEIRQPLLRGRGAFINRAPIVVSRINTDQQIANLDAQLQNFVTNVEIRYWDLYCAYRSLDAAKSGRDKAAETWRIVEDQASEGADVNAQQVAQAAEQYHFFNSQVIDAYNTMLNAEGALRFLMGWSTTDGLVLRPVDEPVMAPLEFEWVNSLCEALAFRPELRQERWEIKKRELALAYSKNGLLPEFNVSGTYRWIGNGNLFATSGSSDPFPSPSSGALNELFDGDFQEFALTGEFRLPIGFRRELANVRNAQVKLARELARLEEAELEVSKELAEAIRALQANHAIMQSAFNRWKETRIETDYFEELEREGIDTLNISLDSQRRQTESAVAFYTAVCEYNKVIALIHRRKGTTLPHSGIEFTEGPWAGKAYDDAYEHARRRSASRPLNYGWSRPNVISRGADTPTDGNPGFLRSGGNVGQPAYNGEVIVPEPVINDPYVSPSPIIDAPSHGSQTRNAQPSPTEQHSQQPIQQVSYEEPVANIARVLKASTPAPRHAEPSVSDTNRSQVQPVQPERDLGRRPIRRLRAATSGDALRTSHNATRHTSAVSASRVRQEKTPGQNQVQHQGVNWERMGFTRPSENPTGNRATIKRQ